MLSLKTVTSLKSKGSSTKSNNFNYAYVLKLNQLFCSGQRFAFGHHYLRPHETFHEPTRKFFPNEVMRIPLYEKVSFDLILDQCWVLDLPTYCKGRPMGAKEEHVYICEFRIDKTARLFTRLPNKTARQSACQFSMKSYAFESFESKLKPVRSYTVTISGCEMCLVINLTVFSSASSKWSPSPKAQKQGTWGWCLILQDGRQQGLQQEACCAIGCPQNTSSCQGN